LSGTSVKLDRASKRLLEELQARLEAAAPEEAGRLLEEYGFDGPEDASEEIDAVLYG
jgi:hypothetical protein